MKTVKSSTLVLATCVAALLGFGAGQFGHLQKLPQAPLTASHEDTKKIDPAEKTLTDDETFHYLRYTLSKYEKKNQACFEFNRPLSSVDVNGAFIHVQDNDAIKTTTAQRTLCITDFKGTQNLNEVRFDAQFAAANQEKLGKSVTVKFDFSLPVRERLIAFAGSGVFLPRIAATGIAVETRNIERMRMRVVRMPDDRVLRNWPKSKAKYANGQAANDNIDDDNIDDDNIGNDYTWHQSNNDYLVNGNGFLVWDGTMTVENKGMETTTTSFPLTQVLPERRPGAYLLIANDDELALSYDNEARQHAAQRWVIESDLGLTLLQGEDGLHVLVRSYDSAKPVEGIEIALVALSGKDLARARSDASGRVFFPRSLLRGDGDNRPRAVFAYGANGEFTLTDINRPAFDLSDRGVSGQPALHPITAFLYSDRGIYRPGEVFNLSGLIRSDTADAFTTPVTLIIKRPNGAEFRRIRGQPDAAGGLHYSTDLPPSAARGHWSVEAYADPTDTPIGHTNFEVQDFVPQRIATHGHLSAPLYDTKEPPTLTVDAQWLYGAPASELNAFGSMRLQRDLTPFAQWRGWHIGRHDDPFEDRLLNLDPATTDNNGAAELALPKVEIAATVPIKLSLAFGVYEPGGRPVQERLSTPVLYRDRFLAIKPSFEDNSVLNGTEAILSVAALNAMGDAIDETVTWRLEEERWDYVWYRDQTKQGRWSYRVVNRLSPISNGTWTISAKTPQTLKYITDSWRRYRLTVESSDGQSAASYRFASGYTSTTPDNEIPDKVAIASDLQTYPVGGTVHLAIKAPFAGEALVSVATNRILWSQNVQIPAGAAAVDIPVQADWGAGAYVLVDAVRPLQGGSSRDPVRAIGAKWIETDTSDRKLAVSMDVAEIVKPETRLTVPVQVKGAKPGSKTIVTVALVDEGVLALTKFISPDPIGFYFGKRRLGVDIRDDYGRLLDGQLAQAGRTRHGGDEVGGAGLTTVPTKTLALFSGPVDVDENGKATLSFDIPDFIGQVRLMAVAYNGTQVGQGDANIRIRGPVIADAFFPRFLAPGDQAVMTVQARNISGPEGDYNFHLSTTGVVEIVGERDFTSPLKINAQKRAEFRLTTDRIGIGTIRLEAKGPSGLNFTREWSIESRSAQYPISILNSRLLRPKEQVSINPASLSNFYEGSFKGSANFNAVGNIDVAGLIQSLYLYPYGCTEQITSTAAPLLALNDFEVLGTLASSKDDIRKRVQTAIDTLLDRQTEDGAIGLWRSGDGQADSWLVVYAYDFLFLAKERGYIVSDEALARGSNALRAIVQNLSGLVNLDYFYVHEDDEAEIKTSNNYASYYHRTQAYAHYLLARTGEPQKAILLSQFSDYSKLKSPISRGFFAAALAFSGERSKAQLLFANTTKWDDPSSGYYGSILRNIALFTSLAAESLGPENAEPYLKTLDKLTPDIERLSTQEKAWLLRLAIAMKKTTNIIITENGVEHKREKAITMSFPFDAKRLGSGITLTNQSDAPIIANIVLRGAPIRTVPPASNGFTLEKTFFTDQGETVDVTSPDGVAQHDRLVVVLQGNITDKKRHQIVLVDLLPAGWEIESVIRPPHGVDDSPPSYPWLPALSVQQMGEKRDDRFVAVFELNNNRLSEHFYWIYNREDSWKNRVLDANNTFRAAYVVRAVTKGDFTLPAAQVEDMYQPLKLARTAIGSVHIHGH